MFAGLRSYRNCQLNIASPTGREAFGAELWAMPTHAMGSTTHPLPACILTVPNPIASPSIRGLERRKPSAGRLGWIVGTYCHIVATLGVWRRRAGHLQIVHIYFQGQTGVVGKGNQRVHCLRTHLLRQQIESEEGERGIRTSFSMVLRRRGS